MENIMGNKTEEEYRALAERLYHYAGPRPTKQEIAQQDWVQNQINETIRHLDVMYINTLKNSRLLSDETLAKVLREAALRLSAGPDRPLITEETINNKITKLQQYLETESTMVQQEIRNLQHELSDKLGISKWVQEVLHGLTTVDGFIKTSPFPDIVYSIFIDKLVELWVSESIEERRPQVFVLDDLPDHEKKSVSKIVFEAEHMCWVCKDLNDVLGKSTDMRRIRAAVIQVLRDQWGLNEAESITESTDTDQPKE
jgi:hypothetical protein